MCIHSLRTFSLPNRIAMILCYCHENITEGLALLRHAASSTTSSGHCHLPPIYALALILRDSRHAESDYYLNMAASLGFLPAWQEKLTAAEMRAQFGDLDATKLVQYLDPPCLNRLMGRHYLECQRVKVKKKHHRRVIVGIRCVDDERIRRCGLRIIRGGRG